jgi:hypothetical protein
VTEIRRPLPLRAGGSRGTRLAENSIVAGDEVRYKNFPDRMTVKRIWRGQAYCRWIRNGKPDGFSCRDLFPIADLSRLLPRPSLAVDAMTLAPSTVVCDGRIPNQVNMLVSEQTISCRLGDAIDHRVYCVWQDGGIGFGFWFDVRDLEYGDG